MSIIITQTKIKEYDINRYYLEITLSEMTNPIWEQSFKEALNTEKITSMRGSGAPVVNKLEFHGDKIITQPFAEYAKNDLPAFLNELKHFIDVANKLYNNKLTVAKQREVQEEREKQERAAKLDELNKWLDSNT